MGGLMGEGGGGVGFWDDVERLNIGSSISGWMVVEGLVVIYYFDSFFGVCCFVLNIYEYWSLVDFVIRI